MRRGGGKQKGAQFERDVCKALSKWVSADESEDLFWRSAMSGGRASVGKKQGKLLRRQAGDISAVSPEGATLTDRFYIECKFYADLALATFILEDRGPLACFWHECVHQAKSYKREPLLIVKQNRWTTPLVITYADNFKKLTRIHPLLIEKHSDKYCVGMAKLSVLLCGSYNAEG